MIVEKRKQTFQNVFKYNQIASARYNFIVKRTFENHGRHFYFIYHESS